MPRIKTLLTCIQLDYFQNFYCIMKMFDGYVTFELERKRWFSKLALTFQLPLCCVSATGLCNGIFESLFSPTLFVNLKLNVILVCKIKDQKLLGRKASQEIHAAFRFSNRAFDLKINVIGILLHTVPSTLRYFVIFPTFEPNVINDRPLICIKFNFYTNSY